MKPKLQMRTCSVLLSVLLLVCCHLAQAQAPTSNVVNNTHCTNPNGSITFTAPTPLANFQFSIDAGNTFGAPGQTVFSGLFGGTYSTVSKNITTGVVSAITSKVLLNATTAVPVATITNSSNCTTPNGSITFTPAGPIGNFQYSIDGGTTWGTAGQNVFSNLAPGNYSTMVKSIVTTCVSGIVALTITRPVVTAPVSTVTNLTSCTTPNGVITFTAPTPLSNYSFSVDGGTTYGTPGQVSFTGLSAGNYSTRAKVVSSGCQSPVAAKTITSPAITAPTATLLNPTTCTTPNGRITFTGPTPLANYRFSIDGGTTWGTAGQVIFNSLSGGTYQTVARLTSSGCASAKVAQTLVNPAITAPTSTVLDITNCTTPNGRITFSAPTPVANYSFSVDGGVTFGTAGQLVFNGLVAGTYKTVAKLNSTGCVSAAVNKIVGYVVPAAPTLTGSESDCTNSGIITFTAPTPVADYQFSIDNGATYGTAGQTVFSGLSVGTYFTRTKQVSTGCSSFVTLITVNGLNLPDPTSTVLATTNCISPNGSITFTGPTPLANYEFSVDNGVTFHPLGDPAFSNLAANTYKTVARAIGTECVSLRVNKVVGAPVIPSPVSSVVNVTNCAAPNGSITFSAPSSTTHVFSIDGGLTYGAPGVTTFNNVTGGTYSTMAKLISSGCPSPGVNKTVTKPVNAGADQTICSYQPATMTATAIAGGAWSVVPGNPAPTTFTSSTVAATVLKGFSVAGTYNFIWKNAACADTVSVIVSDCANPIGCTNTAFLFQSNGTGSNVIGVDISNGNLTPLYPDNTPYATQINAVGFNITDGYIWGSYTQPGGYNIGTGKIARIGADGVPLVFDIPGIYNGFYNVGTVDENGILYLYASDQPQIFKVDVNPASPTYLTLLAPVLTTTAMSLQDFAYNPVDGSIYGVTTNTSAPIHEIMKINKNTGAVTSLGEVTGDAVFQAGTFGANYFDLEGNMYVGDNIAGGIYKISQVQTITGATKAVLRSQGGPSTNNDGALCHLACVKPDAGPDTTTICRTATITMQATQVSGIGWLIPPGNPGTAIITKPDSANTTIHGFSAPGIYNFIWTNGGNCNDTTSIIVLDGCIVDTKDIYLNCPPEPVVICGTVGALPRSSTTVYSVGALSEDDLTQGSLNINANGCAVWEANANQTNIINTFIASCTGLVCDTTYITIYPPTVSCALPVKLVSFNASKMDDASIRLEWITASEENSKEFTIERSTDGKNWKILKTLPGATTSHATLKYQTSDNEPSPGLNYYRLKMVDHDETYAYSRIRSVDVGQEVSTALFPNPTSNNLTIRTANWHEVNRVELINAAGLSVYSSKGAPSSEISVKSLPAGTYLVRLTRKDGTISVHKLMIAK
jgi:hypothetical protein